MNLGSKILAAAIVAAVPCTAGLAAAAPLGSAPATPTVQNVDWRGGHWHGEYFPDRAPGFAYAAPYGYSSDYDYGPGYPAYAYGPDYGYGYASPGYSDYGYSAPNVTTPGGDIGYCEQRFRSYDPASGTYLGYDGLRHPCP